MNLGLIGVCKKKNPSVVFSGERKISTLGSIVPVGNSASLVSHWNGCVPLPEWTGMDIITGMDYRNGHYAMALGALNVF